MSRAVMLPKVDENDPVPKYVQAREILLDAIRSGSFAPEPNSRRPSKLVR